MNLSVAVKTSPFKQDVIRHTVNPGHTLEEILLSVPELPPEVWTHGVVHVGDVEVPRHLWSKVRPKPGSFHMVTVGVRLSGGGDGEGGKSLLATIATIALLVAAAAVSGGALAGIGGTALFAAGSTSAAIAAAGVSVLGSLAINALFPPPSPASSDSEGNAVGFKQASIDANALEVFEPIPFVLGKVRVAPPHLILPWSEIIDDDSYANTIIGLNGPHLIENIWLNDAPIDEFGGEVEYEVYNGEDETTETTLIDKQVFESVVNTRLSQHKVNEEATDELTDASTPSNSYPQWHVFKSRFLADEIWMHLQFAALADNTGTPEPAAVPFQIQMKLTGTSTWLVLPEIHLAREINSPFSVMIKFSWLTEDTSQTKIDTLRYFGGESIWNYAFVLEPFSGLDSNDYFGTSYLNVNHVRSDGKNITFFLDESSSPFTKGVYDIRIRRGYAYTESDFDTLPAYSSYALFPAPNEEIPYFFTHVDGSSPPDLLQSQATRPSQCSVRSISTVLYEDPLPSQDNLTLIAIRVKNTSIRSISAEFTGYANTWDGADWDTFEPTQNPAAWFRALALGQQTIRSPYVLGQLDTTLEDWFDYCDGINLACNTFVGGNNSVGDILDLVASCGRAVRRVSDGVGVVIEEDRSSENPIQLFSQRNTAGLSMRRAFPRIPHGLRVRFTDEDNDYKISEVFVYRAGFDSGNATEIESVTYTGVTTQEQAVDRGILDLGQLTERAVLYELDCDIEHLYCQKGSLVALAHDTIRRHYDAARVISVSTSGGNVTGIVLDSELRLTLIDDYDADFPAGVIIQLKDGTTIVHQIDETTDTDTVTFTTPFAEPAGSILEVDCLVVAGPFSRSHLRLYVKDVKVNSDMSASLVLVDEAPLLGKYIAYVITAESAAYSITPSAATIGFTLLAESAAYVIATTDADLTISLLAESASYTIAVTDADLQLNMPSESAAYSITAQDADLPVSVVLTAESAAYSIAAQDADLTPSGVSSITQVGSATSTAETITAPATVNEGDWLVLVDFVVDSGGSPSSVVPSGFTEIATDAASFARMTLSHKLADGTEDSATLTGMTGDFGVGKALYQFRGDVDITSVNLSTANTQATTGNPSSSNAGGGASGGTAPLVVLAAYATFGGTPVNPRDFSPTEDGELVAASGALYLLHKIYNTSPADVTVDMDDEGSENYLFDVYAELS